MRHLLRHRAVRFIGWAAAYVLALQTMLLGFGAVPTLAAGSAGSLSVQLCLTGGDGDHAGEPAPHVSAEHCLGCLAAATALPPPAPDISPVSYPAAATVGAGQTYELPAPAPDGRPNLPRAPPFLA